jgi:RimJ/RimL family protein N-acetyltransferase
MGCRVGLAFGVLGLRRLDSGHAADNPASGRVLRRLGFEPAGEAVRWSRPRAAKVQQRLYRRGA